MSFQKGEPMKTCLCLMVLGLIALPAYSQEVELTKPGEIVIAPRGPKERGGLPFFSEDGLMGTRDRNVIIGAATGYDKGEELLQYGNWYGPGWWGGGKDVAHAGDRKPVDSLDATAMRHDFAYQLAEQQGRIHGLKEEQRLKAMADMIAVKETLQLDADPSKWPQPPSDPEKANRYRDRIISGFDYTSGARDGTATVMNATDWVTSPLINYEMDTSNQYDEEQLKRSVGILANNWAKNHPNATADDATVEQQEQRSQEEQKRAVAEAKAQARRDEEDRKVDPTGTKEFSLETKMKLPEDFPQRDSGTSKPSDENKEAIQSGAAGHKTTAKFASTPSYFLAREEINTIRGFKFSEYTFYCDPDGLTPKKQTGTNGQYIQSFYVIPENVTEKKRPNSIQDSPIGVIDCFGPDGKYIHNGPFIHVVIQSDPRMMKGEYEGKAYTLDTLEYEKDLKQYDNHPWMSFVRRLNEPRSVYAHLLHRASKDGSPGQKGYSAFLFTTQSRLIISVDEIDVVGTAKTENILLEVIKMVLAKGPV